MLRGKWKPWERRVNRKRDVTIRDSIPARQAVCIVLKKKKVLEKSKVLFYLAYLRLATLKLDLKETRTRDNKVKQ